MSGLSLFALAIGPGIFLALFFSRRDPGQKEPRRLLIWTFILGALTVILAGVIESFLLELVGAGEMGGISFPLLFLINFFFVALLEESSKLAAVYFLAYRNNSFNEVTDGITYTVTASLGFATLENLFYVMEGGHFIGFLRAAVSVPNHAMQSGIMGYYVGLSKFDPGKRRKLLWKGLLYASLLHATTNAFLFSGELIPILIGIPFMLGLEGWILGRLYKKAIKGP